MSGESDVLVGKVVSGGWRLVGGGWWGGLFLAAQMLHLNFKVDPPRTRCVRYALETH